MSRHVLLASCFKLAGEAATAKCAYSKATLAKQDEANDIVSFSYDVKN